MLSSRLFWQLFLGSGGVVALVGLALGAGVTRWEEQRLISTLVERLSQAAQEIRPAATAALGGKGTQELQTAAQLLARDAALRITVIQPGGEVLFDTAAAADQIENLKPQPEFAAALQSGSGSARRLVAATGEEMLFYALRLDSEAGRLGVVRVGTSLNRQSEIFAIARRWIWGITAAGIAAAFAWSAWTRTNLTRPLSEMTSASRAMIAGDYQSRAVAAADGELGDFVDEFERLRRELADQIDQLRQNGERLASVLGSMIEGVLAVDDRERILFANRAARTLLEFATPDAVGRPLLEAVRNRAVLDVVRHAFRSGEPTKSEFTLAGTTRRVVAVNVGRLPGNPRPGVLLVLHDVSDLRRLESLRQEFVANVSHELKTPLTAIKAYSETLLDGALADGEHNEAFVRRIAEQAERLHQLIMDLLSLARIEAREEAVELVAVDLARLVEACVATHRPTADARKIQLMSFPPTPPVRVSADEEGLRQILDNLIVNAIKYTPEGGQVLVRWSATSAIVRILVEDTGIGIAPEDQERVFERFYRVDKARSRDLGGTGLGLSIVKHLSQSFGGGVSVRSEVGRGSTFMVWLPLAAGESRTESPN